MDLYLIDLSIQMRMYDAFFALQISVFLLFSLGLEEELADYG